MSSVWNDETWTFDEVDDSSWGSDASAGGSSSYDWGAVASGVGNTVNGLANIYAKTWSQTQLMQQAQNGQRYYEGQRMQNLNQITGGISPIFLILGAGLVFLLATKG